MLQRKKMSKVRAFQMEETHTEEAPAVASAEGSVDIDLPSEPTRQGEEEAPVVRARAKAVNVAPVPVLDDVHADPTWLRQEVSALRIVAKRTEVSEPVVMFEDPDAGREESNVEPTAFTKREISEVVEPTRLSEAEPEPEMKAEPSKAEPSKAEPSKAEPSKVEPTRLGSPEPIPAAPWAKEDKDAKVDERFSWTEPPSAEPPRVQPPRVKPSRVEPSQVEVSQVEASQVEVSQAPVERITICRRPLSMVEKAYTAGVLACSSIFFLQVLLANLLLAGIGVPRQAAALAEQAGSEAQPEATEEQPAETSTVIAIATPASTPAATLAEVASTPVSTPLVTAASDASPVPRGSGPVWVAVAPATPVRAATPRPASVAVAQPRFHSPAQVPPPPPRRVVAVAAATPVPSPAANDGWISAPEVTPTPAAMVAADRAQRVIRTQSGDKPVAIGEQVALTRMDGSSVVGTLLRVEGGVVEMKGDSGRARVPEKDIFDAAAF